MRTKKMHERNARGDTGAGIGAEHKLCRGCRTWGLRVAKLCFFEHTRYRFESLWKGTLVFILSMRHISHSLYKESRRTL